MNIQTTERHPFLQWVREQGREQDLRDYLAFLSAPLTPAWVLDVMEDPVSAPQAEPVMGPDGTLTIGNFALHPCWHEATKEGMALELTAKEFSLLYLLASHPRQVFTPRQLLQQVWGSDGMGDHRTVTVHVHRLREKLELEPSQPRHLRTIWGVGYAFAP